ncbi:hypothetical protein AGMMS50212_14920 [Spirochaetia bacterium]|nr:hypothetical protein AGMMS50212_14920 [Spirochaetia bacterium]
MEIKQTKRFSKAYKKLHANQLADVNNAIASVIASPEIGEQKKGDLAWLRVYKFPVLNQLTLLGYEYTEAALTFVDLGAHENFYRDLKK